MKTLPLSKIILMSFISLHMGLFYTQANADEIDDLKRQIELLTRKIEIMEQEEAAAEAAATAQAEAIPVETVDMSKVVMQGDRRNSIKIPGTDTSLSINGRVETSLIYDIGPRPTSRGGDIAAARRAVLEGTPEHENRGDTRLTARNSRFNIQTTTPTRLGLMRTFMEGDFNGLPNNKGSRATTNRTAFGIRHAYGEFSGTYGTVLFGQYWSSFMDRTVFPDKVDGTGPVGRTFIRQGQLRYTKHFEGGGEWAFALENPRADFDDADDENLHDGYPDLVSFYRYETDRWHLQFTGLLRRVGINDGLPGGVKDNTTSWGMNQSGRITLPWNEDEITWYLIWGDGIGRYMEGAANQGTSITADGRLDTQFSYGGFLTYKHWWSDTLHSNIDFGVSYFDLNPEEVADANKELYSSHINLIWDPIDKLSFGIEYIWARREVHDGREGTINRAQFISKIFF